MKLSLKTCYETEIYSTFPHATQDKLNSKYVYLCETEISNLLRKRTNKKSLFFSNSNSAIEKKFYNVYLL